MSTATMFANRWAPALAACLALGSLTAWIAAGSAHAQGIDLDAVREVSKFGPSQIVLLKADCRAWSNVPNHPAGFLLLWEGPCEEGYAQGEGVLRLLAAGKTLSTAKGRYHEGHWQPTSAYTLSTGHIIQERFDQDAPNKSYQTVAPESVPAWATDIVLALPQAQADWEALVALRLLSIPKSSIGEPDEEGLAENEATELFGPDTPDTLDPADSKVQIN